MTEKRGSWYLLTGVIIGLLVGIVLSLWVIPVRYVNTDPSTLREADRQAYRILIAEAYLVEGDTGRALARLGLLKEKYPSEKIIAQAQSMLAIGGSESEARALALLAAAVNEPSLAITPLPQTNPIVVQSPLPVSTATSSTLQVTTPAETNTPGPTSTPRPTPTPLATAGPPFAMEGKPLAVCDPLPAQPLLQITVKNAAGQPVPGVKIEISQTGGGVETFYTGLYPAISLGYADYEMLPGTSYTIRVGESGQPVTNLSAPACEGDAYGSLKLEFQQP
jgi:hypothetical protein